MNKDKRHNKEEKLIKLIKTGNRLAFNELYELYWKELFSYAYKILSSKELSEDVVQDVFLRIWANKNDLEINKLKPYLFNATRNSAVSKLRQVQFNDVQLEVISELSINPIGETQLDYEDLRKNIDAAIEGLPSRCKEIFYLSRIKNHSIDEIAEEFNISKRTVENQISVALKHIRPQLTDVISILLITDLILLKG